MDEKRIEKKDMLVQPRIAADMMELQLRHSLPIEIRLGGIVEGLREVSLEYKLEDYEMANWLINKATNDYVRLAAALDGMDAVECI